MEKNAIENAEQAILQTSFVEQTDILESCRGIIKELRVDWDTTLSESFNPLHLALRLNKNSNLNTEFRDMSHKLEFFLDKIITSNFQGFSESLNSFTSFRNTNKKILETLDACGKHAAEVRGWSFNRASADIERESIGHTKSKYEMCKKILEARNHYRIYQNSDDLIKRSVLIGQCLAALNDKNLQQIRGVLEYLKLAKAAFLETSTAVSQKLFDFIFRNEIENLFYFKAMVNLGSVTQFDEYCQQHFDQNVFGEIEKAIMREYKAASPSCLSDPLGELESLSSEVCRKVESIQENMSMIVQRCSRAFAASREEDFFGVKKDKKHFVMAMDAALECIKSNLKKFIDSYSKEETVLTDGIDVDDDVDETDYARVYRHSPICRRLQRADSTSSFVKKHFTVIATPNDQTVTFVLNSIKNSHLRSFVRQLAEGTYFSSLSVEKNMFRVDSVFRNSWMDIDPRTGKTNLLVEVRSIVRSCRSIEEERKIKAHLRKRLLSSFLEEYNRLFTSEFVKRPGCSQMVEHLQAEASANGSRHDRMGSSRVRIGILPKESGNSADASSSSGVSSIDLASANSSSMSEGATREKRPGRDFLPKGHDISSYVVSSDEFNEMLVKNYIDKGELFDNGRKYARVVNLISTLKDLDCFINCNEVKFVHELYSESLKNQALLDCFYYFDLLYRQGNYNLYMKRMAEALTTVYREAGPKYLERFEEALELYCVKNVYSINAKNRLELENFVANLEILGEILGEVGLSFKFEELLRFFREGKTVEKFGDKYTRILTQKIS